VEIGGKWPNPENVEAIRRAVDAIPPRFLRAWIASGGRLEIVPGSNASIHPRFSSSKPALGWTKFGTAFCAVAGDHADSSLTATHELGHALDFALRYPSHSAAWMRIWQADVAAGKVSAYAGQRDQAAEYFAEQFGNLWHPDIFIVSKAAQDFIMQLVAGDERPPATLRHSVEGCRAGALRRKGRSMTQTSTEAGKMQASPRSRGALPQVRQPCPT